RFGVSVPEPAISSIARVPSEQCIIQIRRAPEAGAFQTPDGVVQLDHSTAGRNPGRLSTVMRGHSASKTRVNALMSRASNVLRTDNFKSLKPAAFVFGNINVAFGIHGSTDGIKELALEE